MRHLIRLFALLLLPLVALANTPGKHSVTLTWTASTTAGVTYNLYRGSAAGVCSGNPTPYASGLTTTQFVDTANLTDGETIYYNVSAVKVSGKRLTYAGLTA